MIKEQLNANTHTCGDSLIGITYCTCMIGLQ